MFVNQNFFGPMVFYLMIYKKPQNTKKFKRRHGEFEQGCVLRESYTATDALPPILPACRQLACSLLETTFVTRDFLFSENLFVNWFVHEPRFHCVRFLLTICNGGAWNDLPWLTDMSCVTPCMLHNVLLVKLNTVCPEYFFSDYIFIIRIITVHFIFQHTQWTKINHTTSHLQNEETTVLMLLFSNQKHSVHNTQNLINPFRSYVRPRPTLWSSCPAPLPRVVRTLTNKYRRLYSFCLCFSK
jgi:hypothetical protein